MPIPDIDPVFEAVANAVQDDEYVPPIIEAVTSYTPANRPTEIDHKVRSTVNPSFRFIVDVGGNKIGVFTKCTLPTVEWKVDDVEEGGLNTHIHHLPSRRKKGTLVLENGVGYGTLLMQWFTDAMKEKVARYNITVTLLNPQGEAAMVWFAENCLPFKWTGPALKSDDKVIAIQKLEFTCGEITCNILT